jgi:hypothetical protein
VKDCPRAKSKFVRSMLPSGLRAERPTREAQRSVGEGPTSMQLRTPPGSRVERATDRKARYHARHEHEAGMDLGANDGFADVGRLQ